MVTYRTSVTAAQVRALAEEWEISLSQARAELQNPQGPFLEQWWTPDGTLTNKDGEWRKVEFVIEDHVEL
jgi:hypothetical protein